MSLPKTYQVKPFHGDLVVTGEGSSPAWQDAVLLSDFSYPWEDATPLRTSFKALHDDHHLFFLFEVEDSRVHVDVISNEKTEVIDSSRVEIFFRKDARLMPYYCLELDAAGRVLDYIGHYHRQFDFGWRWPADGLKIAARRQPHGYSVEGAISKDALRSLGVLSNVSPFLEAGLYRAECTHTVVPREHMRWISWVRPEAPTPDFHIPSSFGRLQLMA